MRWNICRALGPRSTQISGTIPVAQRIHEKSKHKTTEDKEDSGPIPFSTSKASHRVWTVAKSFGSDYQRPWWKVLPVSLLSTGFVLWCFFRKETELDKALYSKFTEVPVEEVQVPKKET